MGCARYHLHIDRHSSPLAVGHAQFFEQATHGTMLRHRPLFAVNDYLDHHRRLLTKKKPQRVACGYLCPVQTPVLQAPIERLYKVNGASLLWHYPGQVLRVVTTVTASHGHSQHRTPLAVWLNIADPPYICKPALD